MSHEEVNETEEVKVIVKCIKCEQVCQDVFWVKDVGMIGHGVVILNTRGNYGSRVYDGPDTLEMYICDDCFIIAAGQGCIYKIKENKKVTRDSSKFLL